MESDEMRMWAASIKARHTITGLRALRQAFGIIETALVMAMEGVSRATAAEIAARAARDLATAVTAAQTGKVLHGVGITSVISHGKSKLVLDVDALKTIRNKLATSCTEKAMAVQKVLTIFNTVADNVKAIEDRWTEIQRSRAKERDLSQRVQEDSARPSRLPELERRLESLRDDENKAAALEKECVELEEKLKALPSLQVRRDALNQKVVQYHQDEHQVAAAEARLGQVLADLKMRSAWVTYVDLDSNIQRQRAELEQLSLQLTEKRSLWQRMFGPKGS